MYAPCAIYKFVSNLLLFIIVIIGAETIFLFSLLYLFCFHYPLDIIIAIRGYNLQLFTIFKIVYRLL